MTVAPASRRCSAPDLSRLASKPKVPILHSAETSLLVRVTLPAAQCDRLLRFKIKPGGALEKMQQGIESGVTGLISNLRDFLDESDLDSNERSFGAALAGCEDQLQEWQMKLSEAQAAQMRSDTVKAEMARMKESYLKEIALLRQQLGSKLRAEEKGENWAPQPVSLLATVDAQPHEGSHLSLKVELERAQANLNNAKIENRELMHKLQTAKMQATFQQRLMSKRMDLREYVEAEVQTTPPSRCDQSTATEAGCPVDQEAQTDCDVALLRLPGRRRTSATSPCSRRSSRAPTSKLDVRDASNSDDEATAVEPAQANVPEVKVVRVTSEPPVPSGISIAVQVEPEMLSPMSPRSPHPGGRRPFGGHVTSQASFDEDTDPEEDADTEVCHIMQLPRVVGTESEGGRSRVKSTKSKTRAVTMPSEADLTGTPLMTISSQAHCLAFVPKDIACATTAARPSSRNIAKPRFARPQSRGSAATPTSKQRVSAATSMDGVDPKALGL